MKRKIVILAAGKGTRMKSDKPKVMYTICNVPMLQHVIDNAKVEEQDEVILVVGYGADQVQEYFGDTAKYVLQKEQLGTGHAVMMAMDEIEDSDQVVITYGDTPLIGKHRFVELVNKHHQGYGAVLMSALVQDPTHYGRILSDDQGFCRIVEERDATEEQRKIKEINVGTYVIGGALLKQCIAKISNENDQNEYYITDVFELAAKEAKVGTYIIDEESMLGINSKNQLAQGEAILRDRINQRHMDNGVTMIDPRTTYVDSSVVIEEGCVIYPNTHLRGNTVLKKEVVVKENSTIENSEVGSGSVIWSSILVEAKVGKNTTVGPFAYLRPKAEVGDSCKVGDFVEIKNATFGNGSKASHLAYIGDAEVGENVNIGCGVVFVNYDGVNKYKTTIGDNAFIGSNANLVAPVKIGDNTTVAAGSTITNDVSAGLAIARQRQENIENWKRKSK